MSGQKNCKYCGELIDSKAKICRYCTKSQGRWHRSITITLYSIITGIALVISITLNVILIKSEFKKETNLLVSLNKISGSEGEVLIAVSNTGNYPCAIKNVRLLKLIDSTYLSVENDKKELIDSLIKYHYPRFIYGKIIHFDFSDSSDLVKREDGSVTVEIKSDISFFRNDKMYKFINFNFPSDSISIVKPLIQKEIQSIMQKTKHYSYLTNDILKKFNYKIHIETIPLTPLEKDEDYLLVAPQDLKILKFRAEKFKLFGDFDNYLPYNSEHSPDLFDYYLEVEKVDYKGNYEYERIIVISNTKSSNEQYQMEMKESEVMGKVFFKSLDIVKEFHTTPDTIIICYDVDDYEIITYDSMQSRLSKNK